LSGKKGTLHNVHGTNDDSPGSPEAHHPRDSRVSLGYLLSSATQPDLGGVHCRVERGSGQVVQVWNEEGEARANTKIMLLHLHPVNLTLQMAGFALLLYGI
jgi:hypothetical protein